jgi:hypothetical protein
LSIEFYVPHSTSQQTYQHKDISANNLSSVLLKEQLQSQRRESYLYAQQLEREHHKARVALGMTPAQLSVVSHKQQEVEQGCQLLLSLLTRLGLQHQYNKFHRRGITYDSAKQMSARDFSMLGLPNTEALRLANTLSYATTVQKSYVDVNTNAQKQRDHGPPLLFRDAPEARINRLSSPSTRTATGATQHRRRLSALGRDLLDVFETQLQPGR